MNYLAENNTIGIRKIQGDDFAVHRALMTGRYTSMQLLPEMYDYTLQKIKMEQIRVFTIIDKQTGKVCGFCQFDMEQETEPEFGIDILDDYMGLGYGFQA